MKSALVDIRSNWRPFAFTLILGLAGALLFQAASLPLPWVIGPMFMVTGAAMLGRTVWMPIWLRSPMVLVIGALFGTTVRPDFIAQFATWLPSMVMVVVYVVLTALVLGIYLNKVVKHDFVTATLSAAPGGIIPMTLLSEEYGGNDRVVALMQSTRLIWTVLAIPIAFRLFAGYVPSGNVGTGGSFAAFQLIDVPVMLVACIVGYYLARLVRLPTPELMGPMIVVGILTVTGQLTSELPEPLVAVAQLIIGIFIGVRFNGTRFKEVASDFLQASLTSTFMIAAAALFAWTTSLFTGISVHALILGFAPGGFAEMSLIGFGLGIDVSFVVVHQLMRYIFIVLSAPLVVGYFSRRLQRRSL